jgi:RimJ/RimL family protein N-acetyltransferase
MNVDGVDELELGWWVARDLWGQGIAIEAAKAALADLQTRCYIGRVISIIHVDNQKSHSVAERLGMKLERETLFRDYPVRIYSK